MVFALKGIIIMVLDPLNFDGIFNLSYFGLYE